LPITSLFFTPWNGFTPYIRISQMQTPVKVNVVCKSKFPFPKLLTVIGNRFDSMYISKMACIQESNHSKIISKKPNSYTSRFNKSCLFLNR
jgi:hypothetical protein